MKQMEVHMNAENQNHLYVNLNEAAIMADRSSRTIYNWLQAGKIEAKKEDENNNKSKWLILRSSLMGYLATEVKTNPPRKSSTDTVPQINQVINNEVEEKATIEKKDTGRDEMISLLTYETLKSDMKLQQVSYEKQLLELQKNNATLQQKLENAIFQRNQKDEMIEFLKQMQPSLDGMRSEYEKRIETLTIKAYETEKELSIVSERYALECSKGILARIFTRPQEFKLLTDGNPNFEARI